MVKKAIGDTLDYLAGNLKTRAEQLAGQLVAPRSADDGLRTRQLQSPISFEPRDQSLRAVGELPARSARHRRRRRGARSAAISWRWLPTAAAPQVGSVAYISGGM